MTIVCQPALALPAHRVSQPELIEMLRRHCAGMPNLEASLRLVVNTTVQQRHFAIPLEQMLKPSPIAQRVEQYLQVALELALDAIERALSNARLSKQDIAHLIVTSCTIPAVLLPGLDAHIVNAGRFPQTIRRLPIAQMGCHGGATALAQAHSYLLGRPDKNVLICAVELCSLNEQPDDTDASMFVSRGLFGDAACAVVVRGDEMMAGLRILETNQYIARNTLSDICYRNDDSGNHFETKREVLNGVQHGLGAVRDFLAAQGCRHLDFVVAHNGGPRVLERVAEKLKINIQRLAASQQSLQEIGNVSSVTVLDVLRRTFEERYRPKDGDQGLLLAFGPGTTTEMAQVAWQEAKGASH